MNEFQQLEVTELPGHKRDIIIVGAGPAGGTAAAHLASKGHQVLFLDRSWFPRDKACGDILLGDAIRAIDRLGLSEKVRQNGFPQTSITISSPAGIECEVNPRECFSIRRSTLDGLIAREAVRRGAEFARAKVQNLRVRDDGLVECHCDGLALPLVARTVVIATGANRDLLFRLGLAARSPVDGVALRYYVKSEIETQSLIFSYDPETVPGYRWLFPMGNGEYNIGCGIVTRDFRKANLRKILDDFVTSYPAAKDVIDAKIETAPPVGAGIRCSFKGVTGNPRIPALAIGDTAGATLPLTGEGIGKAMETGEDAAEVIHEAITADQLDLLCRFPDRMHSKYRKLYRQYEWSQRWLSDRRLNNLIAGRMSKSPWLRDAVAQIADQSVNPASIFSLQGIFRSISS
ncbi:MAG: geranylgeranyl reductase family protein [Verrucomicrobiales bacterium]|nr:geranylgeranyl reductase family protein [Verrucomicrobiales bacterium]